MVTPEVTSFAQTGGLGEVLSALPAELAKLGLSVDVLMPKYRGITPDKYNLRKMDLAIDVDLNARITRGEFWEYTDERGVRMIFLENDEYYDRPGLYGLQDRDYEDNSERFVFLCRAALEMALAAGEEYDLYHAHDWQSALVPVYLRTLFAGESLVRPSAAVMTIHNLGYQGIFWHWDMPIVGVGWEHFTPGEMEFYGDLNFLKSGIVFADKVNTVSPTYRNEIMTPDFGFGLDGVLREKDPHVAGILNGVDYSVWNPETDRKIAARYDTADLSGKKECKTDLQSVAGLTVDPAAPVIGMVSRLSSQKGLDLLQGAAPGILEEGAQMVILGTGETAYHESFSELASQYPDRVKVFLTYDQELAHKIFAGSDMILVPSRYEPCGLNQMYALKYGSIPIVRATGGLNDTVEDFDGDENAGTGFKFVRASVADLERALDRAMRLYRFKPDAWKGLMIRAMKKDFSWNRSAREYVNLYEDAVKQRRDTLRP